MGLVKDVPGMEFVSLVHRAVLGADAIDAGKVDVVNEECQLDGGGILIWKHWMA